MDSFKYTGIELRRNIPNFIIPNITSNYNDRVFTFEGDPFIYVNPINIGGLTPVNPIPGEPILKAGESEILTLEGKLSLGSVSGTPPGVGTEIDMFLVEYYNQETESLSTKQLSTDLDIIQEEVDGSRVSFYKSTSNPQMFNFKISIPNTRRNIDHFKTRYFKLALQLNSRSTLDRTYLGDVSIYNISDNNVDNSTLKAINTIYPSISFEFYILKTTVKVKVVPYSTLRGV